MTEESHRKRAAGRWGEVGEDGLRHTKSQSATSVNAAGRAGGSGGLDGELLHLLTIESSNQAWGRLRGGAGQPAWMGILLPVACAVTAINTKAKMLQPEGCSQRGAARGVRGG